MVLKPHVVPLRQPEEQETCVSQEDAWLNDVGQSRQLPKPSMESQPEAVSLSSLPLRLDPQAAVAEAMPLADPASAYIGAGHALWPIVLRLSEHIWQKLSRLPAVFSLSEALLAKFVQKQAIDLLRAEPGIAQQLRDVAEAELVLLSVDNEVLGYGPLEPLMKDTGISEIMVAGPRFAYVERHGHIEDVPALFEDDRHMLRIIENILRRAGRHLQPNWPIVDVRLLDGSLVNVVLPPSSVNGPTITIRKGSNKPFSIDDLVQLGTMSHEMGEFLRACVQARLNMVICGGVNAGRTTLLNALGSSIAEHEHIATIEDVAELQLTQRYVVALVSQLSSPDTAAGAVSMRDLLLHALRTGSERIMLGECRGDEVVELFQAMYNGCSGTLMTLFANDLRDCLTRLEAMYLAGSTTMPLRMVRAQVATALHVVIYISRLRDGSRKILNIAEVQGTDGDMIKLQSLFHYKDTFYDAMPGKVEGTFESSGFSPTFLPKFEAMDIHLPPEMFRLHVTTS